MGVHVPGRNRRINNLKKDIEVATKNLNEARDKMSSNGFIMEDIKEYNKRANELGMFIIKLNHEEKHMKPKQYMEEIKIPNNIIF